MPMPLWVMFSPIQETPDVLLNETLVDFLASYCLTPCFAMPLAVDDGDVIYCDAEAVPVTDKAFALAVGRGRFGLSIDFVVPQVRRDVRFVIFGHQAPYTLCVAIEREILTVEHNAWGPSGWIVNFISKLSNKLGVACSVCSRDARFVNVHKSLDFSWLIDDLRAGRLLNTPTPAVFTLRSELIDESELSMLIETQSMPKFRMEHDGEIFVFWSV